MHHNTRLEYIFDWKLKSHFGGGVGNMVGITDCSWEVKQIQSLICPTFFPLKIMSSHSACLGKAGWGPGVRAADRKPGVCFPLWLLLWHYSASLPGKAVLALRIAGWRWCFWIIITSFCINYWLWLLSITLGQGQGHISLISVLGSIMATGGLGFKVLLGCMESLKSAWTT